MTRVRPEGRIPVGWRAILWIGAVAVLVNVVAVIFMLAGYGGGERKQPGHHLKG